MAFYGLGLDGGAFNPPQDRSLGQVPGEHVIPLLERTDDSAAQMILALVHDCFIAINHLRRGLHPEDFFIQRFRLLSLYITPWEIEKYEEDLGRRGLKFRYEALVSLYALRRSTLFSSPERQARMIQHFARSERRNFHMALGDALAEPFVGMDSERASTITALLEHVETSLEAEPVAQGRADEICNAFRAFFKLPPWSPSSPSTQSAKPLTPEREIAMIYDIFHGLNAFYINPRHVPAARLRNFYISLRNETKDTVYHPNDPHARFFVLARDALCGLLAGPFPMGKGGAYHAYVEPLLKSYRKWYLLQEHDVWTQLEPDLASIARWFEEGRSQPARRQRMRRLLLWLFTSSNLTGLGLLLPDLYPGETDALLDGVEMGTILGLKDA